MSYISDHILFTDIFLIPYHMDVTFQDAETYSDGRLISKYLIPSCSSVSHSGFGIGTLSEKDKGYSNSPFDNIPFDRVCLCRCTKTLEQDSTTGEQRTLCTLEELGDETKTQGVCYGITRKDKSIQINCGISVVDYSEVIQDDTTSLVLAVIAKVGYSIENKKFILGEGETIIALSEALDPYIYLIKQEFGFNVLNGSVSVSNYNQFTVRGNLAIYQNAKAPSTSTSYFYDTFSIKRRMLIDGRQDD